VGTSDTQPILDGGLPLVAWRCVGFIQILDGLGHWWPLQGHDATAAVVLEFIESVA
jgi:hypothetical protein